MLGACGCAGFSKSDRSQMAASPRLRAHFLPLTAAAMDIRDLVRLRKAKDRMDREYDEPLDVPALARSAAMSTGHFSRSFKAAFGEGPYKIGRASCRDSV